MKKSYLLYYNREFTADEINTIRLVSDQELYGIDYDIHNINIYSIVSVLPMNDKMVVVIGYIENVNKKEYNKIRAQFNETIAITEVKYLDKYKQMRYITEWKRTHLYMDNSDVILYLPCMLIDKYQSFVIHYMELLYNGYSTNGIDITNSSMFILLILSELIISNMDIKSSHIDIHSYYNDRSLYDDISSTIRHAINHPNDDLALHLLTAIDSSISILLMVRANIDDTYNYYGFDECYYILSDLYGSRIWLYEIISKLNVSIRSLLNYISILFGNIFNINNIIILSDIKPPIIDINTISNPNDNNDYIITSNINEYI